VAHTLVEGLTIVLIVAVVLSLSILLLLKVKAKTSTKIGLALARALVFSVIIYLPLIDQPRISGTIVLPIMGAIVLVFGIVLVVLAGRELMKTELWRKSRSSSRKDNQDRTLQYHKASCEPWSYERLFRLVLGLRRCVFSLLTANSDCCLCG
jgi:hypothetical protein